MTSKLVVIAAGFGLILAAVPLRAHHSFAAEYDANKVVKLSGTVTKLEWTNPHAWFYTDVKDESGKVTNWAWELGSPNSLTRAGWSRTSMKIGDAVNIEGSRAKDGSNVANVKTVTLSNGQRLFGGGNQGPAQQ